MSALKVATTTTSLLYKGFNLIAGPRNIVKRTVERAHQYGKRHLYGDTAKSSGLVPSMWKDGRRIMARFEQLIKGKPITKINPVDVVKKTIKTKTPVILKSGRHSTRGGVPRYNTTSKEVISKEATAYSIKKGQVLRQRNLIHLTKGSTGYYVGSSLLGGSSDSEIASVQGSIQPSPNSNAKGSGVDMATSTPLVVENVGTLNQNVNVEAGANTDNKNAITSMSSVEMPSAVPIHGEQASNIVTPYFVGKDPRNQGYDSLQKQVMGRVDRSSMNRSKSLLRG
tara:strand:- start:1778 stop:2623 length:846 start_codon:yes stop_codon:yes gene_type:complete